MRFHSPLIQGMPAPRVVYVEQVIAPHVDEALTLADNELWGFGLPKTRRGGKQSSKQKPRRGGHFQMSRRE